MKKYYLLFVLSVGALIAAAASGGMIYLAWEGNPPAETVDQYIVAHGNEPPFKDASGTIVSDSTMSVAGLSTRVVVSDTEATYFAVAAHNDGGTSDLTYIAKHTPDRKPQNYVSILQNPDSGAKELKYTIIGDAGKVVEVQSSSNLTLWGTYQIIVLNETDDYFLWIPMGSPAKFFRSKFVLAPAEEPALLSEQALFAWHVLDDPPDVGDPIEESPVIEADPEKLKPHQSKKPRRVKRPKMNPK